VLKARLDEEWRIHVAARRTLVHVRNLLLTRYQIWSDVVLEFGIGDTVNNERQPVIFAGSIN
jgi:hypothetical protein